MLSQAQSLLIKLLMRVFIGLGLALLLASCSDGNSSSATTPPGNPPPANTRAIAVELNAAQSVGGGAESASASASFTINLDNNTIGGTVNLSNIQATSVELRRGFAGAEGTTLIALTQVNGTTWQIPSASAFSNDDIDSLDAGSLFVEVFSADFPDGALRGQFINGDIRLIFADADGTQEIPPLAGAEGARVALTINNVSGAVNVHVNTQALDDATMAHIHQAVAGLNGPVLIGLIQDPDNPAHWLSEDATFDDEAMAALNAGELYLNVHTGENPGGEVRGQILPENIELMLVTVTGMQQVPPLMTGSSAFAAITFNSDSGAVEVRMNTSGLDDAGAAHVHQALAGLNGPVLIGLMQDAENLTHWFSQDATLDAAGMAALNSGRLYINVHTPDNPGGEVRGQIVPSSGIEVVFTALTGEDVVDPLNGGGVSTAASAVAATTIQTENRVVDAHINALMLDDADSAAIYQAPVGQNGPLIFALQQDPGNPAHWMLSAANVSAAQYNALRNQGWYYSLATPAFPGGEVRGQLAPSMSAPSAAGAFQVSSITPANGAQLSAFPSAINIAFNRSVFAAGFGIDRVTLLGSGGDGSFSDGNEINIIPSGAQANGSMASIDLTGINVAPDVYRISLDGTSANAVTDVDGVILDGDKDGEPGGDFHATFTLMAAPAPQVTFSSIQSDIFTPSCAVSGCHSGPNPAAGQNLSAGQAYANIVNVAASEVPSLLRVEPGDADNSYLVQKIEGTAQVGGRMPLGGAPLSNNLIQAVRQWINEGAANN